MSLYYYLGGSIAGVLPGYAWRYGGWTACICLVLLVQIIAMSIAGSIWKPKPKAGTTPLPAEQFD